MFVVVYFVFDQTVEVLSSLKVNQNESNTLKIGEECEVPYETEGITDDGSTVIEEKNYIGKILWLCEGEYIKIFHLIQFRVILFTIY